MKMTKDGITREVEESEVQRFKEIGFNAIEPEPQPKQEEIKIESPKVVTRRRRVI